MLDESSRATSLVDRLGPKLDELTARPAEAESVDFSTLAESQRRAGKPGEARRIAEAGLLGQPDHLHGRIALGLALMDLGEMGRAREVLSAALPSASPSTDAEQAAGAPEPLDRWLDAPTLDDLADPFADGSPLGDPDDLEIDQAFDGAESDPNEMMDVNRVAEEVLDREMSALAFEQEARHESCEDATGELLADAAYVEEGRPGETMDDANRLRILMTLEGWLENIRRQSV